MANSMMSFRADQNSDVRVAKMNLAERVDISVVIPVLNEAENIPLLYAQLAHTLDILEKKSEVIFVDDGSQDETFLILKELSARDSRVQAIRFRRNFGQTAAFAAGFSMAQGEVVVTMDGDLQNDPADIPRLLLKIEEGFDIVSGWRKDRKDPFITRRLPSQIANALISYVTGVKLHDYGCSLKAYRLDVVKNINLYGEMHRFIPALASWIGIQVAELPVNHSSRQRGRSKYGLGRTLKVILDLLTVKFFLGYATRPIQIFGLLGIISFGFGGFLAIYLSLMRLLYSQALADRPLLLLAILLIMLGVQFISIGLIGELVVRTYYESQGKPIYAVREILVPQITEAQASSTNSTIEDEG